MVFHRVATAVGALACAGALVTYAAWPQDYALPSRPGAVNAAVLVADNTQFLKLDPHATDKICDRDWVRAQRPPEELSWQIKRAEMLAGHLTLSSSKDYELDHIIPLCLGGDPASFQNLWLQPIKEARVKDRLEVRLCRAVCAGEIGLSEAQQCIATNWVKCYSKMMGIEP